MKNWIPYIFFLAWPCLAIAQDYGNGWYQSNPNRTFIKLLVTEDGIYRLTLAEIQAAGYDLSAVNTDNLQLIHRGMEQALYVKASSTGELQYLEFFGKRNDGQLDALMYRDPISGAFDPDLSPNSNLSLFTDSAAYFLTWDGQAGLRYSTFFQTNYTAYNPQPYYPFEALREFHPDSSGTAMLRGGGGMFDSFFTLNSDYTTGEGFHGPAFDYGNPFTLALPTPKPVSSLQEVSLTARVFGQSNSLHHFRLSHDGNPGPPLIDSLHNGSSVYIHSYQKNYQYSLTDTTNFIFEALNNPTDLNRISYLSLQYNRLCELEGAAQTRIHHWDSAGNFYFAFQDVGGQDTFWVFDPVLQVRSMGLISATKNGQIIIPLSEQSADLFLATDQAIKSPIIAPSHLVNICHPDSGAQLLIISHPSLNESAEAFAQYRDTNRVNSLMTRVVYTDQIYDEFGFGSISPQAIKNFVNCATTSWLIKPEYLLIWGKGSAESRDASWNLVPSYGYPATDYEFVRPLTATTDFQQLLPVGRVPVSNNNEGFEYLHKINDFEHNSWALWQQTGIFLNGGSTTGEHNAVNAAVELIVDTFAAAPFYGLPYVFNTDINSGSTTLPAIFSEIMDGGIGLLHYFGHSDSTGQMTEFDLGLPSDYQNWGRYGMFMAGGRSTGDYTQSEKGLLEKWVLSPGRGSIVGFGPTAPIYLNPYRELANIFVSNLLHTHHNGTVGEVLRLSLMDYNDALSGIQARNHTRQFGLMGDPSIQLFKSGNDPVDPVWAGDANRDGHADLVDLLHIGLAYGQNGPARPGGSLDWEAQSALPWGHWLPDSVDYKHADCDGNGVIDASDTLAIHLNYAEVTLKTDESNFVTAGLPLTIVYPTTVVEGDTALIEVFLGDSNNMGDVYGVVFTVSYDNGVVDSGEVYLDLSNCWLGTPGVDLLSMTNDDYDAGEFTVALTRTDQMSVYGQGKIADINIVITDDIAKRSWRWQSLGLAFGIAVDDVGEEIPLSAYSQPVEPEGSSAPASGIYVGPNPAIGHICFETNGARVDRVILSDLKGQIIDQWDDVNGAGLQIDTTPLSTGLYLIQYVQEDQTHAIKVSVFSP